MFIFLLGEKGLYFNRRIYKYGNKVKASSHLYLNTKKSHSAFGV